MNWLWNLDQVSQRCINAGLHSPWMSEFMRFATYFGLDQVLIPIMGLLTAFRSTRRVGLQAFVAYGIAGLLVMFVKIQCPRLRPGYPGEAIVAPDEAVFLSSFPSGHTAIAFAFAFTLLLSFPGRKRLGVGIAAVLIAAVVGVSRIYRGIHWPSDVIGSIALAWVAALVSWWLFNRASAAARQRPEAGPA